MQHRAYHDGKVCKGAVVIRVIVCGYKCEATIKKCLKSIQMQTYRDFNQYVYMDVDEGRKYLVGSTVYMIGQANPKPEDIIVLVDADDFLCDEMALEIVVKAYEDNPELLLTYGSYVNLSSNKTGKFCKAYESGEGFRTSEWRGSHLKTFKYKLYQKLPDAELRDQNGEYFKCCADRAMMIPMMEMAGHDRIAHIPMILYCYNDLNPISVWKTMKDLSRSTREYISRKRPLSRIDVI